MIGCADENDDSGTTTTTDTTTTTTPTTPTTTTPGPLAKIDLTGAKSAVIASKSAANVANYAWFNPLRYINMVAIAATGDTTSLFKISDDGYYLEVSFTDASGDAVTTTYPAAAVYSVNADYSVVYFIGNVSFYASIDLALPNASDVFLVNNSTGEAVSIKEYGSPLIPPNYYKDAEIFRSAGGKLFYITETTTGRKVYKFDTESKVFAKVTPETDHVICFDVDSAGNVLYQGNTYGGGDYLKKIVTVTGAVYTVPVDVENQALVFWKGSDGKLYYYKYSSTFGQSDIVQINVSGDGSTVTFDDWVADTALNIPAPENVFKLATGNSVLISKPDYLNGSGKKEFIEVYTSSTAAVSSIEYDSIGISSLVAATADLSSFYLSGNNTSGNPVVVKLTRSVPAAKMACVFGDASGANFSVTNSTTTLSTGEFTVSKMVPNGSGGVIFCGTRLADGQKVIGEISSLGNSNIYQTGSDAEVQALAQLN